MELAELVLDLFNQSAADPSGCVSESQQSALAFHFGKSANRDHWVCSRDQASESESVTKLTSN